MASAKEVIAKVEALAKEDEQFRNDITTAVEAKDVEGLSAVLAAKGFDVAAEDLQGLASEGRELDEAELEAVSGGDRWDKMDEMCSLGSAFGCGFAFGVALWNPYLDSD